MTQTKKVRPTNTKTTPKTLTTAEVRRLLYDIGFVLRLTQEVKKDILTDAVRIRQDVAPPTVDPIYMAVVA